MVWAPSLAYNPQSCFLYDLYIPMSYQRALVVCGKTYVSLLALKCVQIWHLQSSINPHASLFHFAGACWETWHNTNAPLTCSQTGTWYTACCAAIPRSSWKTLKSAICIGCHQAWSSFRPADLDTGSHSAATQCAQRATTRGAQIKTSQRPRVCTSSVCWWGARRPLLLLYWHCVPFQGPPTISVSFITALDGSATASGVPGRQELGLSPPKGQWCCPKASYPSVLQYTGKDGKTVQLWTSVPQKKRGCGWVRKR